MGKKPRVLVVDDDPLVRRSCQRVLAQDCDDFEVVIDAGRALPLGNVSLTRGGRVVGRALDPGGRPLSRANIGRTGRDWQRWTPGKPDGSFVLENVPPGTWTFVVNAMACEPKYMASFRVEVVEGRTSSVECRATERGRR